MLKPNRIEDPYGQDIKIYVPDPSPSTIPANGVVFERGGVLSRIGAGATTGYPGDPANQGTYAADPTVVVAVGLLLYDVIKYDTNRQHENFYKSGFQARVGQKVAVDTRGEYHTNMIPTGLGTAIAAGQPAYLAANGLISNVQATSGGGANKAPQVGIFQSAQDADGYAVIRVKI